MGTICTQGLHVGLGFRVSDTDTCGFSGQVVLIRTRSDGLGEMGISIQIRVATNRQPMIMAKPIGTTLSLSKKVLTSENKDFRRRGQNQNGDGIICKDGKKRIGKYAKVDETFGTFIFSEVTEILYSIEYGVNQNHY